MLIIEKAKHTFKVKDLGFYLIICFAFFLPLNQKVSTIILVSMFIGLIFNIKEFNIKIFYYFIPIILLYFLYAFGYFRDKNYIGIYMFEQKASLLLLPIVFSTIKLNKKKISLILKAFLIGCLVFYLMSFVIASYQSISLNPLRFNPVLENHRDNALKNIYISPLLINNYLGWNFAFSMQKSYLAIYFVLALSILYYFRQVIKPKIRNVFVSLLLLSGIFQIFSFIGIIALGFSIIFFLNKKTANLFIITCLTMFFLGAISISLGGLHKKESVNTFIKSIEKYDNRVIIWPVALEQIQKEKIFGYGYKTAQKVLENNYPKAGKFGYNSQVKKLDTHNEFIQISLELGIIGLSLLIIIIFIFYKVLFSHKLNSNIVNIASVFIGCFLLLSLVESSLNVYSGLSFFFFFNCLFISFFKQEELICN